MRIHLEYCTNKQLNDFYKLGIIGKRSYKKHLNQNYKRTNDKSFKATMDRGTSQIYRRILGRTKYASYKGHPTSKRDKYPITRTRTATSGRG